MLKDKDKDSTELSKNNFKEPKKKQKDKKIN